MYISAWALASKDLGSAPKDRPFWTQTPRCGSQDSPSVPLPHQGPSRTPCARNQGHSVIPLHPHSEAQQDLGPPLCHWTEDLLLPPRPTFSQETGLRNSGPGGGVFPSCLVGSLECHPRWTIARVPSLLHYGSSLVSSPMRVRTLPSDHLSFGSLHVAFNISETPMRKSGLTTCSHLPPPPLPVDLP